MTEVQGGSDVGANATLATPAGDSTYRVSGEKWFCSVADADQFLMTARVPGGGDGTRGLGCFAIPREIDGAPNGFALRRLKDKLGTRGMASGEIDFDGAVAYPIGPVEEGFKTAVGVVLNTSRWLTAVGSTGLMRRAVMEARAYARHRRAFGQPIESFPLVRQTLASMTCEWLAALHLSWMLTELEDAIDADSADEETARFHRFLVNVAKYRGEQRRDARRARRHRDSGRQWHDRGLLSAPPPLPRRDRVRVVGGHAQRDCATGAERLSRGFSCSTSSARVSRHCAATTGLPMPPKPRWSMPNEASTTPHGARCTSAVCSTASRECSPSRP